MLITETTELMAYVPVSLDLDINLVLPSIRKAERRFIIPVLGQDLYRELDKNRKDGLLDDDQTELLTYVCCSLAPFAMHFYSQVGGVTIDSSGIYKPKNDQRWNLGTIEQEKLENAYLYEGYEALDDMIRYLYENVANFQEYADSEEYQAEKRSLVPSASVIQDVFHVIYPRVIFKAMREAIRFIEQGRIRNIMQDYYADLVAKAESELSDDDRAIRTLARYALIYLAASRAIITRTVKLTGEGLHVMTSENGSVSDAENKRIDAAAKELERSGETSLSALVKLLNSKQPTGYVRPQPAAAAAECETNGIAYF